MLCSPSALVRTRVFERETTANRARHRSNESLFGHILVVGTHSSRGSIRKQLSAKKFSFTNNYEDIKVRAWSHYFLVRVPVLKTIELRLRSVWPLRIEYAWSSDSFCCVLEVPPCLSRLCAHNGCARRGDQVSRYVGFYISSM